MSATVAELLAELKPLLRDHGDMPVCVQQPEHGVEEVTFVDRRPSRETTTVDIYSGTPDDAMDVRRFYRELLHIVRTFQGSDFVVTVFHPAHGSEPLDGITTDSESLILTTLFSEAPHDRDTGANPRPASR